MAKAITNIEKNIPNQVEEDSQAIQQLLQAAANHSVPLIKFLDILHELNRQGVLDALQGMLKNSEQIALIGIHQLNKPGAHRIIKNGMGAVQMLSQIDPAKLQTILQGVASGVEHAAQDEPAKKQGLWDILRTLRGREASASLSMMTKFLQGMGKGLNKSH
ncbi:MULTISPECIES: DUF1641 domain-containing protein [unclassified Paenibacillus]|uniref:DUF1641 domain-containing protein n=1 Tax=unclassified Paenibacillus TaxID=185978 RepID=UPI001AE46F60|nr:MULTISPECIES: DUF1641 domain-containing protein [unclassified Paenibacillus]MBP1153784.1 uncharacterized protein YjgD (DUF1641 family) [Paenibacillus sp. PvP091]MBP1170831.1 uncharacterized protein YjgD (DUF1641 family) [Paenibacillus sp. PvR098]MBP2441859.1 uncharacterized protein YjgD (DUF1641 family) [Paenibacillus sp. PvP052]